MKILSKKTNNFFIFQALLISSSIAFAIFAFINLYKSHTVHYLSFETHIEEEKFNTLFCKVKNKNSKFRGRSHINNCLQKVCLFRIPYLEAKALQIFIPNSLYKLNDLNFKIYFPDLTSFYSVNPDDLFIDEILSDDLTVVNIYLGKDLVFHKPYIFLLKSIVLIVFCCLNLYFINFISSRIYSDVFHN